MEVPEGNEKAKSGEKRTISSIQNLQNWLDKKTNEENILDGEALEEKNEK